MRRLFWMTAAVPALAMVAAAQDETLTKKFKEEIDTIVAQSKVVALKGAVMGPAVKGAPYSGVEISESTQTLADGTRIHNETQTSVYRDSEGRMRRETPDQITIMDPVTGTSYFLDPKTQTVHKSVLSKTFVFNQSVSGGVSGGTSANVEWRATTKDGVTSVMLNGKSVDPATMDKQLKDTMPPMMEPGMHVMRDALPAGSGTIMYKTWARDHGESESLGKQAIEGVVSDGTRVTTTIKEGEIGNDRPIRSITERWYSNELQTLTMTRHTDPRTGEETFRLTNVNRNEPPAYLFQVPAGYQSKDRE